MSKLESTTSKLCGRLGFDLVRKMLESGVLGYPGWLGCTVLAFPGGNSSSMSRMLAIRERDFISLRSSSFIFFCTWIVFMVIFSPGLKYGSISAESIGL